MKNNTGDMPNMFSLMMMYVDVWKIIIRFDHNSSIVVRIVLSHGKECHVLWKELYCQMYRLLLHGLFGKILQQKKVGNWGADWFKKIMEESLLGPEWSRLALSDTLSWVGFFPQLHQTTETDQVSKTFYISTTCSSDNIQHNIHIMNWPLSQNFRE